jgi:hypothetical protein
MIAEAVLEKKQIWVFHGHGVILVKVANLLLISANVVLQTYKDSFFFYQMNTTKIAINFHA